MASIYNRGTKDRPNWWIKYKDASGAWRRRATKQPTRETARKYAVEVEARIARCLIGVPETSELKRESLTVAELCLRYVKEYSGTKVRNIEAHQTKRRYDLAKRLLPFPLARLDVLEVRHLHAEEWREALRGKGYSACTVNMSLDLLRSIYTWAIRREIIDRKNPFMGVAKLPTRHLEERYTLDEVRRLLSLRCLPISIAIAIYTGMRRGEIAALRWDDLDLEAGRIFVRRSYSGPTKTDRPRTIPMHSELKSMLHAWRPSCPQTEEGIVAPFFSAGCFRPAVKGDARFAAELRKVLRAAGCRADFFRPWHAFRHTFATLFLESGGAQAALERILGHTISGNRITARYVHIDLPFLARELGRLSLQPAIDA